MKKSLTLFAAALVLTLTACGGQPAAQPTPADEPIATASTKEQPPASSEPTESLEGDPMEYEAGSLTGTDYAFAVGMVIGKFSIPGSADKDLLEVMKRYDDDISSLTFVNVTMDNRQGDEEAHAAEIRAYDAAGKEYLFLSASTIVDAMYAEDKTKMDYDTEYMELFDRYTDSAKPGEVDEFLMVTGDKLPDEFARITVNAGGLIGEVDAVTLEEGKAQGMPLDFKS